MTKKILIIGSSGFMGSAVSDFFLSKKFKVFNLDKVKQKCKNKNTFFMCDIMHKKKLLRIFKITKPDIVINLAARTDLNGKKMSDYKENYLGPKNIIYASNSVSNVKRVIFTSSMLVNKLSKNMSIKENYKADTSYGQSKILMEQIIKNTKCNFEWCIIRPTTIWGDNPNSHFHKFLKLIEMRLFVNFSQNKSVKSFGYIKNSVYQIYKLCLTNTYYFNKKTYYICDYAPIVFNEWTNKISTVLTGKKLININVAFGKLFSKIGDLIVLFNYKSFIFQSFRLKNMLTSFAVDTNNLEKICGKLPYSFDNSIKDYIAAYKFNKKRIFFTFGAFTNQKNGGISRQMYNLLTILSEFHENITTSFKFHKNEYLKTNVNFFNKSLNYSSSSTLYLILINLIYDFFYKIIFYKSVFYETLFFNVFKFSKKTKIILTLHDLIDEKFYNKKEKILIKIKTKIKIFLRKISIKNADVIICVSKNTKKDLLKFYGKYLNKDKKINVIYPGFFNNKEFNLKLKLIKKKNYHKKYILYVGKREGYKNFTNFIKAFAKLKNNNEYNIFCFGSKKFTKSEIGYFNQLGLNNQIYHKIGNDYNLASFYRNAEFLIFPSIYEGFGVPPLEAMYLSCPVLCSNCGAVNEVVGNAALKFNPTNTTSIYNTLNYFLKNKKKLKPALIKKGLKLSKKYSWEKMSKRVEKIYQSL